MGRFKNPPTTPPDKHIRLRRSLTPHAYAASLRHSRSQRPCDTIQAAYATSLRRPLTPRAYAVTRVSGGVFEAAHLIMQDSGSLAFL